MKAGFVIRPRQSILDSQSAQSTTRVALPGAGDQGSCKKGQQRVVTAEESDSEEGESNPAALNAKLGFKVRPRQSVVGEAKAQEAAGPPHCSNESFDGENANLNAKAGFVIRPRQSIVNQRKAEKMAPGHDGRTDSSDEEGDGAALDAKIGFHVRQRQSVMAERISGNALDSSDEEAKDSAALNAKLGFKVRPRQSILAEQAPGQQDSDEDDTGKLTAHLGFKVRARQSILVEQGQGQGTPEAGPPRGAKTAVQLCESSSSDDGLPGDSPFGNPRRNRQSILKKENPGRSSSSRVNPGIILSDSDSD
jgi:hypothetical protein